MSRSPSEELVYDAFFEIADIAFDRMDPQVALDRICGLVYSVEQSLDHMTSLREENTHNQSQQGKEI